MQQWEYLARTVAVAIGVAGLHERLGELGDQGWELVVVTPLAGAGATATHHTYLFKRPRAAVTTGATARPLTGGMTTIDPAALDGRAA